jgi:hypothetical protein
MIISVDFDGVLHSYSSGWQGIDVIPDGPVDGAIEWLRKLINHEKLEPAIYSSRSVNALGIDAMKAWLVKHGLSEKELNSLSFPMSKPPAFLTLDDRAICFTGIFPTVDMIFAFKPWKKRNDNGSEI